MKVKIIKWLTFMLVLTIPLSAGGKEIKVKVVNSLQFDRVDEPVSICINKILKTDPDFNVNNFALYDCEVELSYQIEDCCKEGKKIFTVVNIKAGEQKFLTIRYDEGTKIREFKRRTYSELSMKPGNVFYDGKFHGDHFENVTDIKVPVSHTDHNALFRYEGPGWESEVIGYRFYIDWRNATDIFGKKISGLVLQNVGISDTVARDDSYHSMQDWGMDIFKVGNSLGIGSIGMMDNSKVFRVSERDSVFCKINSAPLKSSIITDYRGWKVGDKKYDLTATLSIEAGSRFTKTKLYVNNDTDNLATGLAKYEGCNFKIGKSEKGWNYISLYGKQTLAGDNLGIAIIYPVSALKKITEDEFSHIIVLQPKDGCAEYYFGAAWEQEPDAIKSEDEFIGYLDLMVEKLNKPLSVEY